MSQREGQGVVQGQFPRVKKARYFDLQVFSYEVSMQIFFGLDLEGGEGLMDMIEVFTGVKFDSERGPFSVIS